MQYIFAIEDLHQKARQEAIARLSLGDVLRVERVAPEWDRPIAIHFRSPRGPKGASLGFAPAVLGSVLADMLERRVPFHAIVVGTGERHALNQLIVGIADAPVDKEQIASDAKLQAQVQNLLEAVPRLPVYVPTIYSAGLVGEQHYQAAVRRCRAGEPVVLQPEPENPHDSRAIAARSSSGGRLGYLPRESWIHRVMLDEGRIVSARIKALDQRNGFQQVVLDVAVGTYEELDAGLAAEGRAQSGGGGQPHVATASEPAERASLMRWINEAPWPIKVGALIALIFALSRCGV